MKVIRKTLNPAEKGEGIMSDVIGQNNAGLDVPAVQQAVDAGGTVVLHGTFNFANADDNRIGTVVHGNFHSPS
jgi:hypothetical protein